MTYEQAMEKLAQFGQEHVLQYYGELSAEGKEALLDQIEETDFSVVKYAANPKANAAKVLVPMLAEMGYEEKDITIAFRKEFGAADIQTLLKIED